ncbi:nuclear transport factor 2 family protein [Gramella sp. BOM4]|nr:nuclear transport factor 2 family protein [Christiangramia bathymodioli]
MGDLTNQFNFIMKKVILLLAVLVYAINMNAQSAKSSIEANAKAMQEAMENGDAEKFGSFFAEDAMFKPSGYEVIKGRQGIVSAHKPMAGSGMKLEIKTDEILDFGDYAHEMGSYKVYSPDGQVVDHGSYSTLWKKTDNGWMIYRDVVSTAVKPG